MSAKWLSLGKENEPPEPRIPAFRSAGANDSFIATENNSCAPETTGQ